MTQVVLVGLSSSVLLPPRNAYHLPRDNLFRDRWHVQRRF
jgi:hypothetical protein